jgi:tRNA-binding protein
MPLSYRIEAQSNKHNESTVPLFQLNGHNQPFVHFQRSGNSTMEAISYGDFEKVEMRVGEIVAVEDFPRARNPSYKVHVYFGEEIGYRWSSAQITHYAKEELIGRQVIAVVNFPPRNIAGFMSECLILGAPMADGSVSILTPTREAAVGGKVY